MLIVSITNQIIAIMVLSASDHICIDLIQNNVAFQLRDDFQESVDMSTYLVAFVVCDFKRVFELTKRNTSVSVYAASHMLPHMVYATTTATRIMDYFESFFGIPYPLPKQGTFFKQNMDTYEKIINTLCFNIL